MSVSSVFSFFSGAGFLDLGFEHAGFDVVFANEVERRFAHAYEHAREAMRMQQPKYGMNVGSIETYRSGEGADRLAHLMGEEWRAGRLIGFIGGPPCPDFSVGGKNRGRDGDNGRLSKTYVDLIVQHKPDWFLFENVKGLLRTRRHKAFFDELVSQVETEGYRVTTRLMNSIEAGVPQDRDRVFMVGFRHAAGETFPSLSWDEGLRYSGRQAFDFEWPSLQGSSDHLSNSIPRELTVQFWFERNAVDDHPNSPHGFKPRAGLKRFQSVVEGDVSRKSYKRLHRNRYSPTAAYGNNEVHIHPTLPRRITAAEALAVQSLPSRFELPPEMPLSSMFKCIGNGVPYLLALHVAKRISAALEQTESEVLAAEEV